SIDPSYSLINADASGIGRCEVERLDTTGIPLKDAFLCRVGVDRPVSDRLLPCAASLIIPKDEGLVFEHRAAEGSSENVLDELRPRAAGLVREKVVRVQHGVAKVIE